MVHYRITEAFREVFYLFIWQQADMQNYAGDVISAESGWKMFYLLTFVVRDTGERKAGKLIVGGIK